MPTFNYQILEKRYSNFPCHIVGKGPSLECLSLKHFIEYGPVIALNDAIVKVEQILRHSPFPIYSLQKDGDPNFMIEPSSKTVLVLQNTEGYSKYFFPKHRARILVDPVEDQGFPYPQVVAIRMAISMALYMGCSFLHLLCCDSLVSENFATFNPRTNESQETTAAKFYRSSKPKVIKDLRQISHEFIIPNF